MKYFKKILGALLLLQSLIHLTNNHIPAQDCITGDLTMGIPFENNFFGGYLKPHRTDLSNWSPSNSDATLNMLFVFVEFTDEPDSSNGEWPANSPPAFMNRFLIKDKNLNGDFWNRYRDSSLSDYYQEISLGKFHVTGEARYLRTYHDWNYYASFSTPGQYQGYDTLFTEIYMRLKSDTTIQWSKFDKWSRNNSNNNYVNERDGYVDMIGIFFRSVRSGSLLLRAAAGHVPLYGPQDFIMYAESGDTIKVGAGYNEFGSGFVAKGSLGTLGYNRALGIAIHEYGHYLFKPVLLGGHSASGIMTSNGGLSINDLFMSGYEKYKLGLLDTLTADYGTTNVFSIRDISGRNGSSQSPDFPQILRVNVNDSDFFVIENRRKISDWVVYMLGDTSRNDPFRLTGDYGKGVYIYHSNGFGINYANEVDIECADGLWNWDNFGIATVDWDDFQTEPVKLRTSLPLTVINDRASTFFNSSANADGISAGPLFSIGKRHASVGQTGTDRVFTNLTEYWTSRERWGDRWDAWNVGYNEVFSPYSNPNTKNVNNGASDIYIYYHNLTNGIAQLKVYRAGFNGYSDSSILAITPPSKPMGIKLDYFLKTENVTHPRITWAHNKEPDMLRADTKKKYRIWRATYTNMNFVPTPYLLTDSVLVDSGTVPVYIDTTVFGIGTYWVGFGEQIEYPVRYEVEAVDKYEDRSVKSDFASGICVRGQADYDPSGPDSRLTDNGVPQDFALNHNSPNPFNPSTLISFDLPSDAGVELKVYDISGRLIKTLVDEFRVAGKYTILFNASDLSSGVYFYVMKAGSYQKTLRMALVK